MTERLSKCYQEKKNKHKLENLLELTILYWTTKVQYLNKLKENRSKKGKKWVI